VPLDKLYCDEYNVDKLEDYIFKYKNGKLKFSKNKRTQSVFKCYVMFLEKWMIRVGGDAILKITLLIIKIIKTTLKKIFIRFDSLIKNLLASPLIRSTTNETMVCMICS
jgi:hypothetical protein